MERVKSFFTNRYIFSLTGVIISWLISGVIANILVRMATEGLGALILFTFLTPVLVFIFLVIYFFIARKVYGSYKEAFSLSLSYLGWTLILYVLLTGVYPLLISLRYSLFR